MNRLWSPFVNALQPYVPGEQDADRGIIKLNTNENPYPPAPGVLAALREVDADSLRLYPEPESATLAACIARYHGLEGGQVFVGNGSDEVLAHTFNAFFCQQQPLLLPDITYSFYPVYCQLYGIARQAVPLAQDYTIDWSQYPRKAGGVVFANPNAPTGIFQSASAIEQVLQRYSDCVVVVDEAYIDFVPGHRRDADRSAVPLLQRYENLLVVRTLSKSRSLAGLRLGYALASKPLIDGLQRVKNSFNSYPVDALASVVAQASFADEAYFAATCARIVNNREQLLVALQAMGFSALDSAANFLMLQHAERPAGELYAALKAHNIWVRYFNSPRLEQFLRISIGSEKENAALLEALQNILSS
ncbi:MAG: histidinol-phosphate transaminase [Pseudomonadales bacterium]|nr:histidinol-phosphate transaminase [Pseudomonadales bacterium]